MPNISEDFWKSGLTSEADDARQWLINAAHGDADALNDVTWRLDSAADISAREYLSEYLRPHALPGAELSILDVGAGPMTFLPKQWVTRSIRITPIDPLAREYAKLLDEAQLVPPVPTVNGRAEQLRDAFPENHFDAVFCRNAFEQFQDPLRGLRQMLAVVKPDHWVLVLQEGMRNESQQQRGPWVLREEDDELLMSAGEKSIDLRDELGDEADVRVTRSWHWPWLLAAFRKS